MSKISRLLSLMKTLRDPEHGCPWDKAQTFESIAVYTLEEAYEVADAIERGVPTDIKDELGDLLLQVVFHSQIAEDQGLFDFADVVEAIVDKLERRHFHVNSHASVNVEANHEVASEEKVQRHWQQVKAQERSEHDSMLAGIPLALPALKRAQKIGSRAASVGFDWPDPRGAVEKTLEEIAEVCDALDQGDDDAVFEEVGDLLFALVNLARHLNVDAESALISANHKFTKRFEYVEKKMKRDTKESWNKPLLEDLEAAWQDAKKRY